MANVVDQIMAVSRRIITMEAEELRLQERLTALNMELDDAKGQIEELARAFQPEPQNVLVATLVPEPKKGRAFGGSGFMAKALAFLRDHPGEEITPDNLAKGLGEPGRNVLAGSTLKRLVEHGYARKTRTAHYLYAGPAEAEVAMV